MATYILLLRGVTPSGRNKIPMARFREVLEKAGFAHVRTYIQSGNALVDTDLPAQAVEKSVRDLIRNQIGPDLVVLARTGHSWKKHLRRIRLQKDMISPGCFLSLLQKRLRQIRSGSFSLWISLRRNLHSVKILRICTFPERMAGGHSPAIFWKRNSGFSATMRNFNTMNRLVAMSRETQAKQEKEKH